MPKLIDPHARHTAIAEATWDLIIRDGIGGVTIRKVAAQAGLSSGSLRHSHPTHDDLITGAINHLRATATSRVQALPPPATTADVAPWALRALQETLPFDAPRAREMAVFLTFSTAAFSSDTISHGYQKLHHDLHRLCHKVVTLLHAPNTPTEATILTASNRLHALLDGLALHLLHQDPGDDTTWASNILRTELEQIADR